MVNPSNPLQSSRTTGRVVIIGGGFSGVATAVNLAGSAAVPLAITVVDPAEVVGQGVAYSTLDADHRLNGPSLVHFLSLDDHEHFIRWHRESGALAADPDSAVGPVVFPRRRDFGTYVAHQFAETARHNPSGSAVVHHRDRVVSVGVDTERAIVHLADGPSIEADLVVVATSNGPPAVPGEFVSITGESSFVADPWAAGAIERLPSNGQVLIVGTGLTMADMVVTLRRERPGLGITAVSRRGLLPRSLPTESRGIDIVELLTTRQPSFLERYPDARSARQILRLMRDEIRASSAMGGEWHGAFDDVRDAAHILWPRLSLVEQARFVRHLGAWYEVHRFRYPPQTEGIISAAIDSGALTVEAARIIGASVDDVGMAVQLRRRSAGEVTTEHFDAVINCTGPERKPSPAGNPLLHRLVGNGVIAPHPLGLGIEIDAEARAIDPSGAPQGRVRVVGPLARGQFGECMGAPHIVARLADVLPSMLATACSETSNE